MWWDDDYLEEKKNYIMVKEVRCKVQIYECSSARYSHLIDLLFKLEWILVCGTIDGVSSSFSFLLFIILWSKIEMILKIINNCSQTLNYKPFVIFGCNF